MIPNGYANASIVMITPWGTEVRMSFGLKNSEVSTAADAADLVATAIQANDTTVNRGPAYEGRTLEGFRWDRVDVSMNAGPSGFLSASHTIGVNGTLDNDVRVTPNTAYIVRKHTALGTRYGRGRIYPPVHYPQAARISLDGSFLSDDRSDLEDRWQKFHDEMTDAGAGLYILHGVGAPSDVLPTLITSLTVESKLATQRRRLR